MRVVRLDIEGFRGIRRGTVHLDGFTVLIGPNNCGKTTLIEALALLFGRDRLVRTLTEHDFFGSDPKPVDRIRIIATISRFSSNDPSRNADWFRSGRAVEKWFDPASGELHPEPSNPDYLLACQIAVCARFDQASLEAESVRYFYDSGIEDPFDDESVTRLPSSLVRDIGFFLVPASRSWDRMMSFGSELFRRTVAQVGGQPSAAVLLERDRLRTPDSPLDEDTDLKSLISEVNRDIVRIFGRKVALKLRLTSTDSYGVLDSVVPHFTELDGHQIPARRQGSGLIALQSLVLLMCIGNVRKANGENFFMVVEEPELHVPPPTQRQLLQLMQQLATQTVITTHSPTVASMPDPHRITLLTKKDGILKATRLLEKPLEERDTNFRRSLYLSDRTATLSAIMQPAVIVPEGKTEAVWLRLLSRVADLSESKAASQQASFTHMVGVIPTKDAQVVRTYTELARVHSLITCLVDGDYAGRSYTEELSKASPPCERIVCWPTAWTIERVVVWICEADPSVLTDPDLAEIGVPTATSELFSYLGPDSHKTDEVVHVRLADAIACNSACTRRVVHVLSTLGSIATGRDVAEGSAVPRQLDNGTSTLWTITDELPGI